MEGEGLVELRREVERVTMALRAVQNRIQELRESRSQELDESLRQQLQVASGLASRIAAISTPIRANPRPRALTEEELRGLFEEVDLDQQRIDDKEICPICHDIFAEDVKVARLSCSHVYHCLCISQWLSRHATCPLCRNSPAVPTAPEI